ncbi:hypothetical protein ACFC5X_04635 [Streptomyces sp. NPDC055952]|uniref:hypothetical protein n=1 Tax=Streptomyces sp. NPDC055952 TaxID=3345663 RepID=UPI0035DF72F6
MSQQRPPVRPDHRTRPTRRPRPAATAGVLIALALLTACRGQQDRAAPGAPAAPAAGVVAPAKVEVIAGLAGCEAEIRTEAEELREGVCRTREGDFLITTFPEERLKETWLESARVYGGTYLVGMRWVVSAEPATLRPLRTKLGGEIRKLSGIGPRPTSS